VLISALWLGLSVFRRASGSLGTSTARSRSTNEEERESSVLRRYRIVVPFCPASP
ncbi:unnamed protein product, partial [Bodo saltans]